MNIIKIPPDNLVTHSRGGDDGIPSFTLSPPLFTLPNELPPEFLPPPFMFHTCTSGQDMFDFLPIGLKARYPVSLGPASWAPPLSSGSEVPRFFLEKSPGLVLTQRDPGVKLKV